MVDEDKQDETEILHPERELLIQGETVQVNEITFVQGLRAGEVAEPLIADMDALFRDDDSAGADYSALSRLFEKHADIVLHLITLCTGKPLEWLKVLNDTDGQNLLMAFWSVNRHFFINRLLVLGTERQAAADSNSAKSTAH